jgi:hypothetical protein
MMQSIGIPEVILLSNERLFKGGISSKQQEAGKSPGFLRYTVDSQWLGRRQEIQQHLGNSAA